MGAQVQGEGVEALHQIQQARVAAAGRHHRAVGSHHGRGGVLQGGVAQFRPGAGQILADAGGVAVTGDVLGQGVDLRRCVTQGLGHRAHGRPGRHGVHIRHHRHVLSAEGAVDVVDDLVATLGAEIHVDVRHLPPVGVEEALEEEVVANRVGGGDVEGVADDGVTGAPAPRAVDAALPCPAHDVVHHQEVVGETHALDHGQLLLQELHRPRRHRPVHACQSPEATFGQQRVSRLTPRDGHLREVVGAQVEVHGAALRDQGRGIEGREGGGCGG